MANREIIYRVKNSIPGFASIEVWENNEESTTAIVPLYMVQGKKEVNELVINIIKSISDGSK